MMKVLHGNSTNGSKVMGVVMMMMMMLGVGVMGFSPLVPLSTTSTKKSCTLFQLNAAKVGIFFGTSTGSTETVAELIAAQFGDDNADGPFDIEAIEGSVSDNFGTLLNVCDLCTLVAMATATATAVL